MIGIIVWVRILILGGLLAVVGCSERKEPAPDSAQTAQCWQKAREQFEDGLEEGKLNRYHKANRIFERIIRDCPGAPFGYHGLLFIAQSKGDTSTVRRQGPEVIARIDAVEKTHPQLVDGYVRFMYGVCLHMALGDREAASEQYQKSCEQGEPRGCNNLGKFMEDVRSDFTRATELYIQSCDRGYGRGCLNAAVIQEKLGGPMDRIDALYVKSCDLEHGSGCFHAARRAQETGLIDTATQFYATACGLGHRASCRIKTEIGQIP